MYDLSAPAQDAFAFTGSPFGISIMWSFVTISYIKVIEELVLTGILLYDLLIQ